PILARAPRRRAAGLARPGRAHGRRARAARRDVLPATARPGRGDRRRRAAREGPHAHAPALRRPAPPARRRARHRRAARAAVPRRADDGLRPAGAPLVLGARAVAARGRHDDPPDDPLPRRGGAPRRPRRRRARRPGRRARRTRPARRARRAAPRRAVARRRGAALGAHRLPPGGGRVARRAPRRTRGRGPGARGRAPEPRGRLPRAHRRAGRGRRPGPRRADAPRTRRRPHARRPARRRPRGGPTVTAAPTLRAPRAAALPGTGRLGVERTRAELRAFFRERDAVIFIFTYPLIMLAIFATVFDGQDQGTGDYSVPFAQYFLPGMIATGVMLTSFQSLAISIAVERDDGSLKRLRATPLPAAAYFYGKVGLVLATSVVQTALLLALAAVVYDVPMPWDMPDAAGRLATFAWVFVLGCAAGAVCGTAFSSLPRSGRSATAVITPVVLVLQCVSGVFFAFCALPTWVQTVASVFPLKWMAQGMRSVFLPEQAAALEPSGSWQHGATAAVLVAWLVVGLVVGARTFRWRRRDDG